MKIREAILKAADHIERNPGEFDFCSTDIPDPNACGTPGCALGWIASFYGWKRGFILDFAKEVMGIGGGGFVHVGHPFYGRMRDIAGSHPAWAHDAVGCARTLRLYADKYHPAAPVTPPNWSAIASARQIPDDVRSQGLAHG